MLLIIMSISVTLHSEATVAIDSTDNNRNWWHLFKENRLSMTDTTVQWPGFLKFCVDVYNWGDRTFNSYDSAYVVGTGRRWKARVASDNWVDSYALKLDGKMPMRMMSDIYCNAAGYLQYMAVSIGYTLDMSNIIGNQPANHKKMEFGFNCARFNINLYYHENTGGTYMRTFGHYNDGHLFRSAFPGLSLNKLRADGVFFFNNRRYSQGAAYNFSKFQLRSAGSWQIGFAYTDLNLALDFTKLEPKLVPYMKIPLQKYRFHYKSYCLLGGYGFNWVLNRHLLYNITALPAIGLTHCYEDSADGSANLFALGINGMTSLTYNLGDFFGCIIGRMNGNWYRSDKHSLFSSIENLSATVGVRF